MRYLTLKEVLLLYDEIVKQTGGDYGIRDLGLLESALAQSKATFNGKELYPSLINKACVLCFSIINNHPFIDGNKRIGHAVMEMFLLLNGYEIYASTDEQEKVILSIASGEFNLEQFNYWLEKHIVEREI